MSLFSARIAFERTLPGLQTLASSATLLCFFFSTAVLAESPSTSAPVVSAEVGFGGIYKVGCFTPLRVTVRAGADAVAGSLEIIAPDGDGVPVRFVADEAIRVPSREQRTFTMYVKSGRRQSPFKIRLVASETDQSLATSATVMPTSATGTSLSATQPVVLAIGEKSELEKALVQYSRRIREDLRPRLAVVGDANELPDRWWGYDGISTIYLTTSENKILQEASPQVWQALLDWVSFGGRLIVSAGQAGEELYQEEGKLHPLAPGEFAGVKSLTRTTGLETFAGAEKPVPLSAEGFPSPLFENNSGRMETSERAGNRQHPTVLHHAFGLGEVFTLAFDIESPPFRDWPGTSAILARVLAGDQPQETGDEAQSGRVSHIGYTDITGQLRDALDIYPGVTLVHFSWVAGLVVVYILLIGPGDYFLLRWFGGRMTLTWLTFPLVIAGLGLLAWLLSNAWRGGTVKVNQVDVVDVDLAGGRIRGTTWSHIYTPQTSSFDLQLVPQLPQSGETDSVLLSWQGLPGEGLGGLSSRSPGAPFTSPYLIAGTQNPAASRIGGLPMQTASTKALLGRWWSDFETESAGDLYESELGQLEGTLANPLEVELTDVRLYYRNWVHNIEGGLAAGGRLRVDNNQRRDLKYQLTKSKVVDSKSVSTAWDETSTDISRILEIMMLHQAVGGDRYTGLTHRYQSYLDLSGSLRLHRAILIGRAKQPGALLEQNGEPLAAGATQRNTFFRLVLPVRPSIKSDR